MLIQCNNLNCRKTSEAKLNKSTDEVICEECGQVIDNISVYSKRTLLHIGQVLRTRPPQAFQKECPTCQVMRTLVLKDSKAFCEVCDTQVEVHAAFIKALKIKHNA